MEIKQNKPLEPKQKKEVKEKQFNLSIIRNKIKEIKTKQGVNYLF